ncbi:hypothetical protein SKAU_G00387150 [Synaphobranchus kaupii]|uniref:Uncharacterized protein n=1 Tax=Synaphobranchus kaupii TaxID=118154 RepID=A0A9Q1EAP7_SYNKA|nr:hypothetical protein SKAU_G00387150 [Synaphobranchus kaupii]
MRPKSHAAQNPKLKAMLHASNAFSWSILTTARGKFLSSTHARVSRIRPRFQLQECPGTPQRQDALSHGGRQGPPPSKRAAYTSRRSGPRRSQKAQ